MGRDLSAAGRALGTPCYPPVTSVGPFLVSWSASSAGALPAAEPVGVQDLPLPSQRLRSISAFI